MDEWLSRMVALRDALQEPDFRLSFQADIAGTLRAMGLPVRDDAQYMVSMHTPDGLPFIAIDVRSLPDGSMTRVGHGHDGDHHFMDCLGH